VLGRHDQLDHGDQLHHHRRMISMLTCQGHFLLGLKAGASVACSRLPTGEDW
jgi:hypothetical protein